MEEKVINNIEQLIDKREVNAIIKESIKEISLCKKIYGNILLQLLWE